MSVTVKQHTEARLADSRSKLELSVDGLDGVCSVGGCLGVVGSEAVGEAPAECGGAASLADGKASSTQQEEGISSPHVSAFDVDLSFGTARPAKAPKWIAKKRSWSCSGSHTSNLLTAWINKL